MRTIVIVGLILLLIGCAEDLSYSYLMTHPQVLKKKAQECQLLSAEKSIKKNQCQKILSAAMEFDSLLRSQQENPVEFGEQIMHAQYRLANAEIKYHQAKANQSETKDHLEVAEKNYQKSLEEVKILWAVANINTAPE